MKRFAPTFAAILGLALTVHADELTKSVQTELKSQGFYYGEVTGLNSAGTAAAIKRFQIRNGLEATGSLTQDTIDALGIKGATVDPSRPPALEPPRVEKPVAPATRAPATTRKSPPVDLRRGSTQQDSDRDYLHRDDPQRPQPQRPDPQAPQSQGPPAQSGGGEYGRIFARTPYASAPLEVQESTVKKAQRFLKDLDFYREKIDGQPGRELEEALLAYQKYIRGPLSGRLDMETLSAMRLLPGRGGAPVRPMTRSAPGRPLRGVWVD